ncbi:glycosyltransferase family 4 protein [Patescibacteria group bacterium]|nr:glycosyltransferase family 4 protein [Patescibacteria group bacterium]
MADIILFTTDFYPNLGGVARYYEGLRKYCDNFQVVSHLVGAEKINKVRRLKFFWPWWPHWLPLVWQIFKVGRQNPLAILAAGQILPVGTALWLWHFFTRRRYFVFLHGLDVNLLLVNPYKKWLGRKILKAASFAVVNSQYTSSLLKNLISDQSKILIIYPCPDLPLDVPSGAAAQRLVKYNLTDKKVILTVGRLVKRKGIAETLDSLAPWLKSDESLVYVIVGDGPEKSSLLKRIAVDNLPVILTGAVDSLTKIAWYNRADIFVMLPLADSLDVEGFGIVYLEAQAAGCLVIGNKQGGVPEAVGQAGLILDKQTELVGLCQRLLADEFLAEKLRQAGRQRLVQCFNWPEQVSKLKIFLKNNL